MTSRHFDYTLEEFPLVTVDDVDACLISGEATIQYDRAGVWEVSHIALDGYRGNKHVMVTAPPLLHALVLERLYGSWYDKVQEAVSEQIETDRIIEADDAADMKLSERKLGF